MDIINKNLEEYYTLTNYLKTIFNKKKFPFIKSVYIHGSFARGEVTPKESDLNVMVFTKNKELKKTDINALAKIKEDVSKKYQIEIEFKINAQDKNNLKNISTDLFYPYLYDFILNSFFIYGYRIEDDLLNLLKSKTYFEFSFETTSVFSKIRIEFLENYFQNNKYKMYYNLDKYARLLNQLKVDIKDTQKMLSKIKNYNKINKDIILNQILKFELTLNKTNLEDIYIKNKLLKIKFNYAKGKIIYNPKIKKILLLEDNKTSCGFWSFPKGKPSEKQIKKSLKVIKKEIELETGLTNLKIIEKKMGGCHHWYEKSENTFKKIYTEYYYVTTDSEELKIPAHINFKWIKISEVTNYISSPCLGYLIKLFFEEVIKKIK